MQRGWDHGSPVLHASEEDASSTCRRSGPTGATVVQAMCRAADCLPLHVAESSPPIGSRFISKQLNHQIFEPICSILGYARPFRFRKPRRCSSRSMTSAMFESRFYDRVSKVARTSRERGDGNARSMLQVREQPCSQELQLQKPDRHKGALSKMYEDLLQGRVAPSPSILASSKCHFVEQPFGLSRLRTFSSLKVQQMLSYQQDTFTPRKFPSRPRTTCTSTAGKLQGRAVCGTRPIATVATCKLLPFPTIPNYADIAPVADGRILLVGRYHDVTD